MDNTRIFRMNIKSVSAIAFAICAGLSSAALFADPAKITQATEKTAIVFPDNIQGRPPTSGR